METDRGPNESPKTSKGIPKWRIKIKCYIVTNGTRNGKRNSITHTFELLFVFQNKNNLKSNFPLHYIIFYYNIRRGIFLLPSFIWYSPRFLLFYTIFIFIPSLQYNMKNVLKCLCIYDAEYIRQAYYAAAPLSIFNQTQELFTSHHQSLHSWLWSSGAQLVSSRIEGH